MNQSNGSKEREEAGVKPEGDLISMFGNCLTIGDERKGVISNCFPIFGSSYSVDVGARS